MTGSNNGNGKNGGKKDIGHTGWEEAREKMTEMLPGTAMAMMGKQVARVARVKQGTESPEEDEGHGSAERRAMTPPAQEERTGKVPVAGKSAGKPEDGADDVGAPVGRHDSEIEGTGDEDEAGDTADELKALVAGLHGQSLGEFLKDSTDDGKEAVEECIKCGKVADAIYSMVEGWKGRGEMELGPGGPKATLPNHVPWTHEYVDILAELTYLADSVNLDLLTLCGLFNKKYAPKKAAIAERFIRYTKAEVDKAVKERDSRFSCWDWAQVYALEAFYYNQ
ncbi:hypothetical protein HDV00_001389, partial [Rhizophlyctis rosea]